LNLSPILKEHSPGTAELMTDDSGLYGGMKKHFDSHDVMNHSMGEYVRGKRGKLIRTNTVEWFFSILERGV
jgi:hypothetical protein